MTANIIRGMPAASYHAMKALSASGAWSLSEECPAKFWLQSPWNPDWEPANSLAFDIGRAAHLAVLEPADFANHVTEIDAADFKTKAAQTARDDAYAAGRTPLLAKQLPVIRGIARSIEAHPVARGAFRGGESEVTVTWTDEGTGVPCKTRVDYLPADAAYLADLKTAVSANPRDWHRRAYDLGYFARAAWYLDGVGQVLGRQIAEYWFVVVEKEPPYLVSVIALDEKAVEWGRYINRRALELFERCAARQDWHGYRDNGSDHDRAFRVGLPGYALFQLQDRCEAGDFTSEKPSLAAVKRAAKLYAPAMDREFVP